MRHKRLWQTRKTNNTITEVKDVLSSKKALTRGEFFRFFAIPLVISILMSFVSLLFVTGNVGVPAFSLPKLPFGISKGVLSERYDPYRLVKDIERAGEKVTIIDVRSPEEYNKAHIKYAVNVSIFPSGTALSQYTPDFSEFASRVKKVKKKDTLVVMYGHGAHADYVTDLKKHYPSGVILAVGWNEWMHFRNLWVPEYAWDSFDQARYIENDTK